MAETTLGVWADGALLGVEAVNGALREGKITRVEGLLRGSGDPCDSRSGDRRYVVGGLEAAIHGATLRMQGGAAHCCADKKILRRWNDGGERSGDNTLALR